MMQFLLLFEKSHKTSIYRWLLTPVVIHYTHVAIIHSSVQPATDPNEKIDLNNMVSIIKIYHYLSFQYL